MTLAIKNRLIGSKYKEDFWQVKHRKSKLASRIKLFTIFFVLLSVSLLFNLLVIKSQNHTDYLAFDETLLSNFDEPIQLNSKSSLREIKGQGDTMNSIRTVDRHPLSADEKRLVNLDEIMVFDKFGGTNFEYNGTGFVETGSLTGYSGSLKWYDYESKIGASVSRFAMADYHDASAVLQDLVSGDIDGDGLDEVVIIGIAKLGKYTKSLGGGMYDEYEPWRTIIWTFDDAKHNFSLLTDGVVPNRKTDLSTYYPLLKRGHYFDASPYICALALGDATGDSNLVPGDRWLGMIQHRAGGGLNHNLITIYNWNNGTQNWDGIYWSSGRLMANEGGYEWEHVWISADCAWGNFDGSSDGTEEFAAATNFKIMIWDWDTIAEDKERGWLGGWGGWDSIRDADYGLYDRYKKGMTDVKYVTEDIQLVTGNFNGGSDIEIAIHSDYYLHVVENDPNQVAGYRFLNVIANFGFPMGGYLSESQLMTIDSNQDGFEEILILGERGFSDEELLALPESELENMIWGILEGVYIPEMVWKTFWWNPQHHSYEQRHEEPYDGYLGQDTTSWVTTGDVDCDGWDEVICAYASGVDVIEVTPEGGIGSITRMLASFTEVGPVLCGSFTGKGMTLSYTENFIKEEFDPTILVAMAAPPTQVGISQAYGNSYTSYGREKGATTTEETSIGVSVSTQIGFDLAIPHGPTIARSNIWAEEFEDTEFEESVAIISTYSTGGSRSNTIIYFQAKFTSYIYTILDHPYDESVIGTHLRISFPENPVVYCVSQEYFNKYYGDKLDTVPVIGLETFNHTIGHPETYPLFEDVSIYNSDVFFVLSQNDRKAVGQGDQFDSIVITNQQRVGSGFKETMTSGWAYGMTDSYGIGIGGSEEETESHGYSISIDKGCVIEGRVGQISDQVDFCIFRYEWGMFFHYKTHPDTGATYLVINYYVQGATPYYPESATTTTIPTAGSTSFAPSFLIVATIIAVTLFKHRKKLKEV